jgi:hypothetical protein
MSFGQNPSFWKYSFFGLHYLKKPILNGRRNASNPTMLDSEPGKEMVHFFSALNCHPLVPSPPDEALVAMSKIHEDKRTISQVYFQAVVCTIKIRMPTFQ